MRLTGSKKNLASNSTVEERKNLAEPENRKISLARQAYLLTVNRTSLYRQPLTVQIPQADLDDMRLIDEIYTACPFYGYRRITEKMQSQGRQINRKQFRRLMQIIGIQGISPENIYLKEYQTPKSLRRGLNQYIRFYNEQRLHGSLEYKCPVNCYKQASVKLAS